MVVAVAESKPTFGSGLHVCQEFALEVVREEWYRPVIKTIIFDIPCAVQEEALGDGRIVLENESAFFEDQGADAREKVLVHQEGCRLGHGCGCRQALGKELEIVVAFETGIGNIERKIPDTFDGVGWSLGFVSGVLCAYAESVFDTGDQTPVFGIIICHDTAIGVNADVAAADDFHSGPGQEVHQDAGYAGVGCLGDLDFHVEGLEEIQDENVGEGVLEASQFEHLALEGIFVGSGDPAGRFHAEEDIVFSPREKGQRIENVRTAEGIKERFGHSGAVQVG